MDRIEKERQGGKKDILLLRNLNGLGQNRGERTGQDKIGFV